MCAVAMDFCVIFKIEGIILATLVKFPVQVGS